MKFINSSRVSKKALRSAEIYKLIGRIQNLKKRNLIRGYCTEKRINSKHIGVMRDGNSAQDCMIVAALLMGPHGLRGAEKSNRKKRTSQDLWFLTKIPALPWRNEVAYTAGYVNSFSATVVQLLKKIEPLARLEALHTTPALQLLLELAREYGASNFISYKLAYLRSARDFSEEDFSVVTEIEREFEHSQCPGLHFSALENVSSKISLFVVAQRRTSGLVGRVEGELRTTVSLSNFIPTPLDLDDVSGFLLRASESSLLDTIHAILVTFNMPADLDEVRNEFNLRLDERVCKGIHDLLSFASAENDVQLVTDFYCLQNVNSGSSLDLYRISSAFLERPNLAAYRSRIDRVVGIRLLSEILGKKATKMTTAFTDKESLLAPEGHIAPGESLVQLDSFYRTYIFLRFIGHPANLLTLTKDEVKFLFENTLGLETLLSESEMRALYIMSPLESKSLVAVLALALYRKRSIDPDVDFEFRTDFIAHVKTSHDGSILKFIDYLLEDSPQVANYIVGSLDEVTLEKMYGLISNATDASNVRRDIMRAVGHKLNRIEYFIEADAIDTRAKLSKLHQYFDSSRMYVDSVAMGKWLDANPSISTEQYRSLLSRHGTKVIPLDEGGAQLLVQFIDQNEYLIRQIAEDAFQQFCLNTEFGIESYLGRRIRHNTLDGVTTDTVDAVLRKEEYAVAMSNPSMRRTVDAWLASYKGVIDKLRREHLQFKASGSLFKSTLDHADPTTKKNIHNLSQVLMTLSGAGELLNEFIVGFCWRQISPQLEHAARFIRTSMLREANAALDKHFDGHHGSMELQIKAELREAVNEVFKKVADWFQVPQTGYTPASAKELCGIILLDLTLPGTLDYSGNAVDARYTGMSVHRLYDCLAVLLQNAHRNSEPGSTMLVKISSKAHRSNPALEYISVDITSIAESLKYERSKERINFAIESTEAGADMVNEGYTGIKKVKYITRMNEGAHTVRYAVDDVSRKVTVGFSFHAETAPLEVPQAVA